MSHRHLQVIAEDAARPLELKSTAGGVWGGWQRADYSLKLLLKLRPVGWDSGATRWTHYVLHPSCPEENDQNKRF